jgi:predicted small metal-binding protein
MRMIDCDCGETLQAANDDDLARVVRQHMDEVHSDTDLGDGQVQELVAERAYSATDA